ncbi:NADPH-dependent pterin aldehyde reductase-like [Cucumis sativus]|uniref:NADPH-dependent pterin aldehyde reductase-like n=1 Tax=Cucumis sativus TaxID=3659 RepID=UPI0012F4EFEA|nr:NADPH-dependent pterin aldehyde reductase-like [Cucumis sativus]
MAPTTTDKASSTMAAVSKKVLITGVSRGLGRALALELATYGHTVIGCSRDQTKLDSLQLQLSKVSPNANHLLLSIDVLAPYCASKWGIEGLSKCIAYELPKGMAIVALDPGFIYTDMLESLQGDLAASKYQTPQHCCQD